MQPRRELLSWAEVFGVAGDSLPAGAWCPPTPPQRLFPFLSFLSLLQVLWLLFSEVSTEFPFSE